ncbi:MAG: B12-binding domain-containing radical SAM protein [Chloroflexota bacterium]
MAYRLVLISPVDPTHAGIAGSRPGRFPPLGLAMVAATTPPGWEIDLVDENVKPFTYRDADLVGLTSFTATAPRAYQIASEYRRRGIPTVMGGIHASMVTDEALDYVDTVVRGEAEEVWPQVIADFEQGHMERVYQGKYAELPGMAWPRRDLISDGYLFATIQTSRGCPMDCEFCSVTAFNGHHFRQRPVSEVLDELESMPQEKVFFVDDNITGFGEAGERRAMELFQGMIDRRLNKQWWCQASIDFGHNEELLRLAAAAGCRMVLLGVEAEDAGALTELGKKLNLKAGVDGYGQLFRRINRHGIAVLGAFISGTDTDTRESIDRRHRYIARNNGINVMQVTFLTPLPGTRLFDRLKREDRLLYTNFPKDWSRYDFTEVLHRPRMIDRYDLMERGYSALKRMYSWPSILRKTFTTLLRTRSAVTATWVHRFNVAYRDIGFAAARVALRNRSQE